MPLYLIAIGICTFPSLLSNTGVITNADFIDIYAKWRHPHHLIVSTFGTVNILSSLTYILYPFLFGLQLFICRKNHSTNDRLLIRQYIIKAFVLIASWCLALLVMYLFIEIVPLSFVAELYPIKYLRYVSFFAVIGYTWLIHYYIEEGSPILAAALLVFAYTPGLLSFTILFFLIYCIKTGRMTEKAITIYFLIKILFTPVSVIPGLPYILILILLYHIFSELDIKKVRKTKKAGCICLLFLICFFALKDKVFTLSEGKCQLITPHDYLIASSTEEVFDLSKKFKSLSNENDVFLARPDSWKAGWMQVLSERSCYVLEKTVPSSKGSIEEWYSRYLEVSGLSEMSSVDVFNVMKQHNIRYLLVETGNFSVYDKSAQFRCFLYGDEDNIRIYERID